MNGTNYTLRLGLSSIQGPGFADKCGEETLAVTVASRTEGPTLSQPLVERDRSYHLSSILHQVDANDSQEGPKAQLKGKEEQERDIWLVSY